MNSAEVLIKFKGDTTEADRAIQEQEKNLDSLQKKGEIAFLGLTAAADAFAGALVGKGIEYNAQIETYLTRLKTLTGSEEEANAILEQIKKDALATPFEVSSLTQAESLLLSTGVSAEQARSDILALGDAISASGGGNAELSRMAVNMQQIKNVGKASALDIKQFAYAGIDIYGLLADSMGVTREEAADMTVTYDMLSTALQKASSKGGKYYGAMEQQSKTYKGAMSNLEESFNVMAGSISEGFFEALKGIIPPLTDMFNWITKNKDVILAIAIPLLTFINIIAGFLIIKKITTAIAAFNATLMANPALLITAGIIALVAGFIYLWNNCEGFRNFFIGMWEGIKTAFNVVINFIASGIEWIVNVFKGLPGIFKSILNGVKNVFSNIFKTIANIVKAPINFIIDGINAFIKGLNKIKIPNWVPGVGGKGINLKTIPKLATGTNYVPQDTLAMIHEGEAVVPKKFNPYANGLNTSTLGKMQNSSIRPVFNVYVESNTDPLGQTVSHIKTFGGGAKNDYNYGVGV